MILVGKEEEKRPLGRPRRRWVDNIKIEESSLLGCGTGATSQKTAFFIVTAVKTPNLTQY
jgi:hypothetical protein